MNDLANGSITVLCAKLRLEAALSVARVGHSTPVTQHTSASLAGCRIRHPNPSVVLAMQLPTHQASSAAHHLPHEEGWNRYLLGSTLQSLENALRGNLLRPIAAPDFSKLDSVCLPTNRNAGTTCHSGMSIPAFSSALACPFHVS